MIHDGVICSSSLCLYLKKLYSFHFNSRETGRQTSPTCWFHSHTPNGQVNAVSYSLTQISDVRDSSPDTFQGEQQPVKWKHEWSHNLNPDTLIWDVEILNGILAVPNIVSTIVVPLKGRKNYSNQHFSLTLFGMCNQL